MHLIVQDSPFNVRARNLRPHPGIYHCCTFCSSNGNKKTTCACGGVMDGGYAGCGHGHGTACKNYELKLRFNQKSIIFRASRTSLELLWKKYLMAFTRC